MTNNTLRMLRAIPVGFVAGFLFSAVVVVFLF